MDSTSGIYTGRILKGQKPADFRDATAKFALVINLRPSARSAS